MTPRKLDKSHGFMQSIIKNQVLRDEYDKEQKLELATSKKKDQQILKNERLTGTVDKETKRNRTSRREAKQLYVPPHMKRQGAVENGEQTVSKTRESAQDVPVKQDVKRSRRNASQKDEESRVLFKFEYEGDDGEVRSIHVKEDDNAEDLAETFGNQLGLTKSLKKALHYRLEEEIKSCTNS